MCRVGLIRIQVSLTCTRPFLVQSRLRNGRVEVYRVYRVEVSTVLHSMVYVSE